jgi:vacuolar-type H+-ATPase subunit H
MAASATGTPDPSLEPIRRVRAVESEWETKLAAFTAQAKEELERLTREAEAIVASTRAELERKRALAVEKARLDAEAEAATIVAEGKERAAGLRGKGPEELEPLRERILSAVLGEFRPTAS